MQMYGSCLRYRRQPRETVPGHRRDPLYNSSLMFRRIRSRPDMCLGWGCLLLELVREERRTWSTLTSSNTGAVSSVCIWEGEGWCCRKTTAVNGEPGSVSLNIPNLKKSVCCLQKLKCYVFCQSGVKFLLAPRSKSAFLNWMTSKETHINSYEYSGMLYNMIKASIYRLFTKCGFNIKF